MTARLCLPPGALPPDPQDICEQMKSGGAECAD